MSSCLEIEDALQVIDRYGFQMRDVGLLASALARPQRRSWVRKPILNLP